MIFETLKSILEDSSISEDQARTMVSEMDHFEIARLMHQFDPEEKPIIFQYVIEDSAQQEVLYETDIESRKQIIDAIGHEKLAPLLDGMEVDEVTDILREHAPEVQEEILEKLETEDAKVIKDLIHYEEETAGGLMNPRFLKISETERAGDLLMRMVRDPELDNTHYFFVTADNGELLGFFRLRDLLHFPATAQAKDMIRENLPKVSLEDNCEKVANLMDHEHMSTLPVVDDQNIMRGIITFDDVLRIIQDEASEDIFTMVGTAKVDPFAKGTMSKVAARVPWLMTTFFGGLISAYLLHAFQLRIAEFATVIFFVPFVLGLAGNVGIQGATVIVRGLATGDVQDDNLKKVVQSELWVGIINGNLFGLLCGVVIALAAQPVLGTTPVLGLSVGLGIILAVSMASVIGCLTPMVFIRLNIDPAISTGPVVTVINDILGLFAYLITTMAIFSITG